MAKLKVLKYNEEKAKRVVILLKFFELFGLFLFTFGLHWLGSLIYNNYPKFFSEVFGFEKINCLTLWLTGFIMLLLVFITFALLVLAINLISIWFKANWRWAQIISEDEGVKAERLSEQKKLKEIRRIEKQEEDRKKFGYCEGDTAIKIKDGYLGKVGKKYIIKSVNSNGNFNIEGHSDTTTRNFNFIKNKLPKKPKLNTSRQKEVDSWKKVK